jgi:lipopolysaccharide transport system ATP-binding protein
MSALARNTPTGVSSEKTSVAAGSTPAIRVDRLGKCYHIYDRPQDRLKQALVPRLLHLVGKTRPTYFREFWALQDVSFEVARGETMGIIGRNGAGKSTLLQIIAGTLAPTLGTVEVDGRAAALLELGSGFNPEFTGRENVYLNASLLGLTAGQTLEKFGEIAAFADIGDFIEQPVKTYSSGMVVRLAFAVQTVVVPDVMIVDEALAVGDVFFQAKCMARLRRLASEGTTILLVTHDTGTVRQMCDRAILLKEGRMACMGSAKSVSDSYLRMELQDRNRSAPGRKDLGPGAETTEVAMSNATGFASSLTELERGAGAIDSPIPWPHSAPLVTEENATVNAKLYLGIEEFRKRAEFNRTGSGAARILNVQMFEDDELRDIFGYGDKVLLRQVVHFRETLHNVNITYKLRTVQGMDVIFGDTRLQGELGRTYLGGRNYIFDWTFRLNLMHGSYCVSSAVAHPPSPEHDDWIFVDVVPLCFDFRVGPRTDGMIGGFVVWDNRLEISHFAEVAGLETSDAASSMDLRSSSNER